MPRIHAPSEATPSGNAARRLARLIGPALRSPTGSVAGALLLGLGDGVVDAHKRLRAALDELFPDTARETLSAWEELVGLPIRESASDDDRRQELVAKLRAAFSGAHSDITRTLRTYAPEATLRTLRVADALTTDPRAVFRSVVMLSPEHAADAGLRTRIDARMQQQVAAHTGWSVSSTTAFRCDDSGCDRDALGR